MAAVGLSARALRDLEHVFEFIAQTNPAGATQTVHRIRSAVLVLGEHPLIGRKVDDDLRELVISRGRSGYVALYRWSPQTDSVLVLSVRAQREAGYAEE